MPESFIAIAIIPARLGSTRLARKVLREIAGKPMIGHVYESAKKSPLLHDVIIATDSNEVLRTAQDRGWKAQMTSSAHRSGTDRMHEVSLRVDADVYVNIQGDLPTVRPEHIEALLRPMRRPETQVATIKTPCLPEEINNPNVVKVVTGKGGRALYFSRAPIPFDRDKTGAVQCSKHLGIYAYRKAALDRFCSLPESQLEVTERLEQLRLLENGIDIYVEETLLNTLEVDTEEDLRKAEELFRTG